MKLSPSILITALFFTSTSYAAGFECTKAKTDSEKAICNTPSLSNLDEILVLSFHKATAGSADAKALKTAQQGWLKSRDTCAGNIDCLTKSYTSRLDELINLVAKTPDSDSAASTPAIKIETPITPPQPTNTTPRETPSAPPEKTVKGTIISYECGDNCYLTVQDDQGAKHIALCSASLCDGWNEVAEMPANYMKKTVQVSIGRAKQYDGSGNEMGEMDAFDSITLLE